MNPQVLVVEDEGIIAADIQDRLTSLGYEVPATVASAEEALQKIPIYSPDLVLMDIVLQGEMDGIDAAAEIRKRFDLPVIFLTAHADESTLTRAKITEPFAYILKPFEERELQTALEMALHKHKVEQERAKARANEQEVFEKTVEATIKVLSKILSIAEPQSYEFGQKLKDYAKTCATALKIPDSWELEVAATLCRIGYVSVPAILIQKMRAGMALTPAEKDTLQRVPEHGRNLLASFPRFESVARIVYYQNKKFDGTGFPQDSVASQNIPLDSRILRVLSDLLQFESEGASKSRAFEQMKKTSGVYDPKVLEDIGVAFAQGPRKGRAIHLKDLCVGQVLVEPIETVDGTLILNAGNTISPWMLKKLGNFTEVSPIREPIYVES
ncbi:MAG: response regulator [Verrucomicrobia bacterium]|nr:response regulator [Verrucomicrobiota bacterium]